MQTSAPDEYPAPGAAATTWFLCTPEGEPVGALRWDESGAERAFAATENASAPEHGIEVQQLLHTMRAEGAALADALASVRWAHEGDLREQGPSV